MRPLAQTICRRMTQISFLLHSVYRKLLRNCHIAVLNADCYYRTTGASLRFFISCADACYESWREVRLYSQIMQGKDKVHPRTEHEDLQREQRYSSTLSLTSALDGDGWSRPRPGRFTTGKDPVSIVQEAGQAPRPSWTGAENLFPTGIRSPNSPARSESLYRLRYPGLYAITIIIMYTNNMCINIYFVFLIFISIPLKTNGRLLHL